jgi:O-antigen/teichoic acid export membrane protein
VIARKLGQAGLGVLVFALAYLEIATTPIGLGTDPYLLRQVARDRHNSDELFFNVLGLKLALAVPVLSIGFVLLVVLGYGHQERLTVALLSIALMLDTLSKTYQSLFVARERIGVLAVSLVTQRIVTAGLGIAVLLAGFGIVAVASVFIVGSLVQLSLATALLNRTLGLPRRQISVSTWRSLSRSSSPFAVQDVLTVLLFKFDAVLLSLLGTNSAVGRYGAAYRLLESTLFVAWALGSGFNAMYAYLGSHTQPTVQAVYARSIKLALIILTPVAIVFGLLAEQVSRLIYGDNFVDAAEPLRLLAPVVIVLCVVSLSSSLVMSRRSARGIVPITAGGVALNVILNVALVPALQDTGSAMAMLATEAALGAVIVALAHRTLGGRVRWNTVVASPVAGGIVLAALLIVLPLPLAPLLVLGAVLYLVCVFALERRLNPADFEFVQQLLLHRSAGHARAPHHQGNDRVSHSSR